MHILSSVEGGEIKGFSTIVINLFGKPSAGKSICAMDITAKLKRKGVNAEYVSEFAKDIHHFIIVSMIITKKC